MHDARVSLCVGVVDCVIGRMLWKGRGTPDYVIGLHISPAVDACPIIS